MSLTDNERAWIENHFDELRKEIVLARIDIATLKVKAGIWGGLAGLSSLVVVVGIYLSATRWG